MYRRKSVGPRIDPWGTPALNGYSCEDFPSRLSTGKSMETSFPYLGIAWVF